VIGLAVSLFHIRSVCEKKALEKFCLVGIVSIDYTCVKYWET
jgi:hypothetical protein